MNRYPAEVLSLGQMVKHAFRLHYLTLKNTIFFILLLVMVKYFSAVFSLFFTNPIIDGALSIVTLLFGIFLFSAAMYSTHASFMDHKNSFSGAFYATKQNALSIYAAFFAYVGIILLGYLIAKLFGMIIFKLVSDFRSPVHGLRVILSATIVLMTVGMFFFVYPLAVIDPKKITKTLYNSLVLSDKSKIGIFTLLFIIIAIHLLISPASLQEFFFSTYHLGVVYDFVVLSVMVPLFINLLLLIINDAKLQLKGEGGVV
jgi:hypothetical protein